MDLLGDIASKITPVDSYIDQNSTEIYTPLNRSIINKFNSEVNETNKVSEANKINRASERYEQRGYTLKYVDKVQKCDNPTIIFIIK